MRLFERNRRGVELTEPGRVLHAEAQTVMRAMEAATHRTRRAAGDKRLVLATKAGASHAVLQRLLEEAARRSDVPTFEVCLCEVGEQAILLRDGRADAAIMHRPVDDFAGLDTADLYTEGQVAIVPASHPFDTRTRATVAELQHVPGLPIARWPRIDGSYPDGPGPEVRTQTTIAALVALGKTLLMIPASSRAWQWPQHAAIPVIDAPDITTVLAWPARSSTAHAVAFARLAADVADALNP